MYKMLVLDFDDTLLRDDLTIAEKTIHALIEAEKKGIIIVFCSGRPSDSMIQVIKTLDFVHENDYFVAFNGSLIRNLKGDILSYYSIKDDELRKLVDIGRKYKVNVQLYDKDYVIVETYNDRISRYDQLSGLRAKVVDSLDAFNESTKVLYNNNNYEVLEALHNEVQSAFGNQFNIFYSKSEFLEILNSKTNKGIAVEYLAKRNNIRRDEIIAIGDSFNDLEMIEYAGLGVAMKNGREEVKKIANYITEHTNNEDGVAEVIEKFILT